MFYVFIFFFQIPLFQRGGSIIATKQRIRRCSALMHNDPYTLTLALNPKVRKHLFTVYLIYVRVALYPWKTFKIEVYTNASLLDPMSNV